MPAENTTSRWIARCPRCPYEVNLETLGWIRIGACSWGKRKRIYCPECGQSRWMRIVHVDAGGHPDQSFSKALLMVFLMLAAISAIIIAILVGAGGKLPA